MMRGQMAKTKSCVNGECVRTIWEVGCQKKPVGRAPAVFFKGLKAAQGDETKIKTVHENLQMSFFAEVGPQGQRQLPAKYTREHKGHAHEGWQINLEVVSNVCTNLK